MLIVLGVYLIHRKSVLNATTSTISKKQTLSVLNANLLTQAVSTVTSRTSALNVNKDSTSYQSTPTTKTQESVQHAVNLASHADITRNLVNPAEMDINSQSTINVSAPKRYAL